MLPTRRDAVRSLLGTGLAGLAGGGLAESLSSARAMNDSAASKPLNVCLLSGCPTYNSEKSLDGFQPWLEKHYPVACERGVRKAVDDLSGLDRLESCDVAFIFFKRMQLKGEQLERFKNYVLSGKPIVAVRTASHAVQTWLEFDREVLGGNYQGHYETEPRTEITVLESGQNHPILQDVKIESAPGPLYKNAGHAADITVLLYGSNPGHVEPIAWTRDYKGGRVFYTSLGNGETFEGENFRRMLAQSLFWAAARDVELK